MRASSLLLALALGVLAGCGGNESADTAPNAAPAPLEVRGDGAELAPGLYTYREFTPALSFRLNSGWEGGHLIPEFFDVFHPKAIVAFAHPGVLIDADGGRVSAANLSPWEALELIAAHPEVDAEPLAEGEIAGLPATVLEFSAPDGESLFGGTGALSALRLTSVTGSMPSRWRTSSCSFSRRRAANAGRRDSLSRRRSSRPSSSKTHRSSIGSRRDPRAC